MKERERPVCTDKHVHLKCIICETKGFDRKLKDHPEKTSFVYCDSFGWVELGEEIEHEIYLVSKKFLRVEGDGDKIGG